MARRRRRSARGFSKQARRKKVWADQLVAFAGITTTPQAVDLLADFRGLTGSVTVGLTVMGINFSQNGSVGVGTGDEGTAWHLGIYVDSRNAAVAELSNPVDDPYEDWMWNTRYHLSRAADSGWAYEEAAGLQRVRSRRVIDELEQTLWLVASPILGTATNLDYAAHFRVVLALP